MYNFNFTGIISNIVALPLSPLEQSFGICTSSSVTYHRFYIQYLHIQSTKDILLVSVEPPHLLQLGVHGRGVEAAAGGQHPPQRGLHTLRHADLAADVEVAAPPADRYIEGTRYRLCVDRYRLSVDM